MATDDVAPRLLRSLLTGLSAGASIGFAVAVAWMLFQTTEQRYVADGLWYLIARSALRSGVIGLIAGAMGGVAAVLGAAALAGLLRHLPTGLRPKLPLAIQVLPERVARLASRAASPFFVGAALISLVITAGIAVAIRSTPAGPNVLVISVDTLRPDHLGAWGYARDTSPVLDRLAASGVRFNDAVANWPKTTPSFVSFWTGTYARTNGVARYARQPLPSGLSTLAELAANAGYATAAVVTNSNLSRHFRFDEGFEDYVEMWYLRPKGEPVRAEHVTDEALAWLRARDPKRPFFFWVHYLDPHAYYEPPPGFAEMFLNDAHFDPTRRAPLHEDRDADVGGIPGRSRLGDHDQVDYYVAQYDAEIRYMDGEIGRLLAHLDEAGLSESTITIFTADHGESLGEHNYYFEHGRLPYDTCMRVPLVVRAPGRSAAGKVVRGPVQLIDVAPTVLDLLGLPASPNFEGRSLVPLLAADGPAASSDLAFTEAGYSEEWMTAVRDERWKLISVPDPRDRAIMRNEEWELYDLATDPGETRNVASEHPEQVARLKTELERWEAARSRERVPSSEVEIPAVDETTLEHLRELGYVE